MIYNTNYKYSSKISNCQVFSEVWALGNKDLLEADLVKSFYRSVMRVWGIETGGIKFFLVHGIGVSATCVAGRVGGRNLLRRRFCAWENLFLVWDNNLETGAGFGAVWEKNRNGWDENQSLWEKTWREILETGTSERKTGTPERKTGTPERTSGGSETSTAGVAGKTGASERKTGTPERTWEPLRESLHRLRELGRDRRQKLQRLGLGGLQAA